MTCYVNYPTSGLFLDDENNVLFDIYENVLTHEIVYQLDGQFYDDEENVLFDVDENVLTFTYYGMPKVPCPIPPQPPEGLPSTPTDVLDYINKLNNSILIRPVPFVLKIKPFDVIMKSNGSLVGHTNPNARPFVLESEFSKSNLLNS